MAIVEISLERRTYQVDVHLDLRRAPFIHVPSGGGLDLSPDKIQITYEKEDDTGEWRTRTWRLQGHYFHEGQCVQEYGLALIPQEEMNRWGGDGMTPKWVAEIVEAHRLELNQIGA